MFDADYELSLFCRAYVRACPELPIRPSQMRVLAILCITPGPHTPANIAKIMTVSRPMIAAHLANLVEAGYVSRVASPDDGRSVYVLPTKSGKKLYLEHAKANNQLLSELSQKMGVKKFDSLIKLVALANKCLAE